MIGAAIGVLGGARTASAQAQPDTAGLVRAVTSVLADSVMPRLDGCNPVFVLTPGTAFDSATGPSWTRRRARMRSAPPAYEWVGTRGVTMRADTAAVTVEVGTISPQPPGQIDTCIEQHLYFFVRDPSGWRYVRRRLVRGLDLGPVRGRPQPACQGPGCERVVHPSAWGLIRPGAGSPPLNLSLPPALFMRIMHSRIVLFVCAALLAAPAALRAQTVTELAPGARVRVVDPASGRVVGTVESVAGDNLVVLSGKGEEARTLTLSLSSIRSVQVSRGTPSRPVSALHGAALGLLTGAASGMAGATIGHLSYQDDCDGGADDWMCFSMAESALFGVIIGAPMGAAWGAVAGFVFPQERWRSITVANPPVLTVNGSPDGVQLGLSITFP